jgi:REP element-mobilizing transposase RayT
MKMTKEYFENTYHHLYNRGANQETIFFEEGDYNYFLKRLVLYKKKYSIKILAYCLIPNHFHLFAKQTENNKTIGMFVGSLLNSYTKFINTKYRRSGVLFQGPTKSKLINDEAYFVWLIKYILLNPSSAKLVRNVSDWKYSSYKEFFEEDTIIDKEEILERFSTNSSFKNFIEKENESFDYDYFRVWS